MSTTGPYSRASIGFEVALDVIGAIIAHHSEQIGLELAKPAPDEGAIGAAQEAIRQLDDERFALDPNDEQSSESVIQRYAPLARALYAKD